MTKINTVKHTIFFISLLWSVLYFMLWCVGRTAQQTSQEVCVSGWEEGGLCGRTGGELNEEDDEGHLQ